jgi:hypothetical protein
MAFGDGPATGRGPVAAPIVVLFHMVTVMGCRTEIGSSTTDLLRICGVLLLEFGIVCKS